MPQEETVRFIGQCEIVDAATRAPIGEGGYVALLLTGAERRPATFLATGATIEQLLTRLRSGDFARKFADRPLELDVAPEPYYDHGPHRLALPRVLSLMDRDYVLAVLRP